MGKLTTAELLAAWEHGLSKTPLERALLLLSVRNSDESWEALTQMSIGQRDHRLLKLREQTFGPRIQALCDCPRCGKPMEMTFDVADILVAPPSEEAGPYQLTSEGFEVHFRLPNSMDLAAVSEIADKLQASQQLFRRCLVKVRYQDREVHPGTLPPAVADALAEQIAQADQQSVIHLEMTCAVCVHTWLSSFDIANFFWTEIQSWAQRTLREVHTLASAYGWSEASILALSPARRQAYLEMVGG